MTFKVTCIENNETYTEETFDELVDLYDEGDIEDNEITLDSIIVELTTLDSIIVELNNTYKNNEVTSMDSIETIEDMQELIDTLDSIENLDSEDTNKLESIIEYVGLSGTNTVVELYDDMDSYEYYNDWTLKDLAENFCEEGILGDAVQEVYENNCSYLDMDYIADQLKHDYIETSYGVIRAD